MKLNFEPNAEVKKSEFKFRELNLDEASDVLNNPKYVIKKQFFDDLQKTYQNKILGEFDAMKLLETGKGLFDELKQKYNIETPVEFFIVKNADARQVIYTVVDKINGQNLEERESLQDIGQLVRELYVNVSKYYLDKLKSGEFFLTDINGSSQYVIWA